MGDGRTARFTVEQAGRIAAQVKRLEGTPLNSTSTRTSNPLSLEPFWAKITGKNIVSGNNNRYQYSWVEMMRTSTGWIVKTGGRSGSVSSLFALNSIENPNKNAPASGDFYGNSVEYTDFQTLLAVAGNPVVWMIPEMDNTGALAHSFSYENSMSCS